MPVSSVLPAAERDDRLRVASGPWVCSPLPVPIMADYSFGGNDEENAELKKLNADVVRALPTTRRPFRSFF